MQKHIALSAILLMAGACQVGHAHDHGDAEAHANKIVPAGTAPAVDNPFHPIKLILSSQETAGEMTLYEFELPPQSPGSPPHTHTLEDEYFYILSGSLDVMVDGTVQQLKAGDFAALTRGHSHMFWNGSDETATLLMATTGHSFEAFMAGVAPRLAEQKPETPAEFGAVIGELAAEHGMTISMELMPPEAAPYYQ